MSYIILVIHVHVQISMLIFVAILIHILEGTYPRGSRYLVTKELGPKTHDIYIYIYILCIHIDGL